MTKEEALKGNKLIAEFCGFKFKDGICQNEVFYTNKNQHPIYLKGYSYRISKFDSSWDWIMPVVELIEKIIGHGVIIGNTIEICYWYSPKKTGTFSKGAGGGGGMTVKREPFEAIFGKFYKIYCYYQNGINFKTRKDELADSKIKAVWISVIRFINWYNKRKK